MDNSHPILSNGSKYSHSWEWGGQKWTSYNLTTGLLSAEPKM